VRLLPALLALLVATPAAAAERGGGERRLLDAAVELLELGAPAEVEVDALGATLVLRTADPRRLERRLAAKPGLLCPEIARRDDGVVLRCRSRRIAARIAGSRLEIRELRGLPMEDGADGPPLPPGAAGPAPCTAEGVLAAAECLLAEGDRAAARAAFEALVDGPFGTAAKVRLGDLALADGDPAAALAWYRRAGGRGEWGRIATARACELGGGCLGTREERRVFDPAGLPPPLHADLLLRAARARAFQGDGGGAVRLLGDPAGATCAARPLLCRRLVLEALRDDDPAARLDALATYERLPDRDRGPLAAPLSRAAAEVAAANGAPGWGGRVLAATVEEAEPGALEPHLRRAAELFLDAGDRARAGVIVAFAEGRLPGKALGSPAWKAIRARLDPPASLRAPAIERAPEREAETDLAAARAAAARAREAARPSQSAAAQEAP